MKTILNKILPHPFMALCLAASWLILAGTYSPASFLMAGLLALTLPHILTILDAKKSHAKKILPLLRLFCIVFYDIVRSNIAVAAIILGLKTAKSGFLHVPLDIRSPTALSILGIIITSTPGTIWVQYDSRSGILLMHILDLVDEEAWINIIKNRYERILAETFE